MEKLVSICVPVFNGEGTIEETLQSIRSQTYSNMEIIVVDNCSTDKTVEIIQSIEDDRIHFYQNATNLGMVGNWNKCLEYVTGEYVHFVSADDNLMPECIEKKLKLIEQNQTVSMVFSASQVINEKNEVVMYRHPYKKDSVLDGKKLAKKSYHARNIFGELSNVLFRAELVSQVGGFAKNTCYATDWDFWLRIACTGDVGYVNQELMQYRISTTNTTSQIRYATFLDDDKVMMQNMKEYGCLELSGMDHGIHRVMYIARMFARRAYMILKSR